LLRYRHISNFHRSLNKFDKQRNTFNQQTSYFFMQRISALLWLKATHHHLYQRNLKYLPFIIDCIADYQISAHFLDAPTQQFTVRLTSRARFLDENRDQLTDTQMRLRPTPQAGRLRPFGLKVSQFVAILVLKSTRVLCRPDSVLFHMSVSKQCTNLYKGPISVQLHRVPKNVHLLFF